MLYMFDRVILLSEGYMIYNGPPKTAGDYFREHGLRINNYCNPADKLCSIASYPRRILEPNITIEHLYSRCAEQLA